MKCSRCGTQTPCKTKGQPLCVECRKTMKKDFKLIEKLGNFALPFVVVSATFKRNQRLILLCLITSILLIILGIV